MVEHEPIVQGTQDDLEKQIDKLTEGQWFFKERKEETKVSARLKVAR